MVSAESAICALNEAMIRASTDQVPLLALKGPVEATDEALCILRDCLNGDPLFGWAAPRIRCHRGCCFRVLSRSGAVDGPWVPRRTLAETHETDVAPELFNPVLLIAPEVVGEFGPLDDRFSSAAGALLHCLSRARRCGFRTVVANRAVVALDGQGCESDQETIHIPEADRLLLERLAPDLQRAWTEFRAESNERFERLTGHAARVASGAERPSILLDIRNVGPRHNGTSRAVLGCLRGLRQISPPWDVTVWANPAAVRFHDLRRLCGGWTICLAAPAGPFGAALRLSQPWHIQDLIDLHRAALSNVCFMLDTISWDVVYAAPPHHDGTWSFLADYADGLLFDSAFSQQRFVRRFARARRVPSAICHYPFAPADYVQTNATASSSGEYVLVVGNELDHKDVRQTVALLSTAFPFQGLVVLGVRLEPSDILRSYPAGSLSEAEIQRLYSGARCIVFPSFYEGFGFPIVTALAYGKTLIARRSDLLQEIAAHCASGRLIAFAQREELVGIVGRLLRGEPVPTEPIGTATFGQARRWIDVAQDIVSFMNSRLRQLSGVRWRERDHAVNQLLAFRA